MASIDPAIFESRAITFVNWCTLNQTWPSFVEFLNGSWWGSVTQERIVSFLNRPEVADGAIVIAEAFGSTYFPVLCSGMLKSDTGIMGFAIGIDRGHYTGLDYEHFLGTPVDLIKELIDEWPGRYLLARPDNIPDGPRRFSGARIVEEMRDMIQLLQSAWWGLTDGRNTASMEYRERIKDLQRLKEEHACNPAAATCNVYASRGGHLFEIITSDPRIYHVTICGIGYKLETDKGNTKHFSTLRSLLDHMTAVEGVTFVTGPIPTLQQFHMREIKDDQEAVGLLPRRLKDLTLET